jgi:rare lipoprotein A
MAPVVLGRGYAFALGCVAALMLVMPAHAGGHKTRPSQQVTRASWYGQPFSGRRTAGGEIYNPHRLTAAHRTLNLGSKVKVTDLRSGRSVIVQITDRGPYFPGRGIDLSYAAARQLGIVNRGVARVRVEPIEEKGPAEPPIVVAVSGSNLPWLPRALAE